MARFTRTSNGSAALLPALRYKARPPQHQLSPSSSNSRAKAAAGPPAVAPPAAPPIDPRELQQRKELIGAILGAGGTGLGLGALARSLIGLNNAGRENPLPAKLAPGLPAPLMIHSRRRPLADDADDDEAPDKIPSGMFAKSAEPLRHVARQLSSYAHSWQARANALVKEAGPIDFMAEHSPINVRSAVNDVRKSAIGIPAITTAAGGGLLGGWKLVDWLLDKQRHGELGWNPTGALGRPNGSFQ